MTLPYMHVHLALLKKIDLLYVNVVTFHYFAPPCLDRDICIQIYFFFKRVSTISASGKAPMRNLFCFRRYATCSIAFRRSMGYGYYTK